MKRVSLSRLTKALKSNDGPKMTNYGFCLDCGKIQDGHEPDAEFDTCNKCGENSVSGAALIWMDGNYSMGTLL